MELDLDLEELLGPVPTERPDGVRGPLEPLAVEGAPAARGSEYELALDGGAGRIRFRLPNGGDQERAARLAASDPGAAADLILDGCIVGVSDGEGRTIGVDQLPAGWRGRLAEVCAGLDPDARTEMGLSCPECGAVSSALFDASTFLLAELRRADGIFAEVDRLARAYHWSEAEILALPLARRRRYLELAAEG